VLNSTANLTNHTIEYIASIASSTPIHLYLDNDKGGYDATKKILNMIPNAQDKSNLYVTKNGSDINDFLIEQKSKKSNN
jgi:DNA primase